MCIKIRENKNIHVLMQTYIILGGYMYQTLEGVTVLELISEIGCIRICITSFLNSVTHRDTQKEKRDRNLVVKGYRDNQSKNLSKITSKIHLCTFYRENNVSRFKTIINLAKFE